MERRSCVRDMHKISKAIQANMSLTGGLAQLVAYGAGDIYLIAYEVGSDYRSANHRDSMMYWFVDRENGFPTEEDLSPSNPFDIMVQHAAHVELPFDVRREKAATRIQARFKEVITNPDHPMCKRRLMREFEELNE